MYTIYGSTGFIGKEIILNLKKRKKKFFAPKRNQTKFNKNLGTIIYCVGSDDWNIKTKKGYFSNLGHLQKTIFNNSFDKIIFLSTTRLYNNSFNKKVSESSKLVIDSQNTNDYYNSLKITSESILRNVCKNYVILRVSNIYGNNFDSPLLLPTLIRNSIKKKTSFINISIKSARDYIKINDLINLIFKIEKKNKHKIYNVASGKKIQIKQIINILHKATGCKIILRNQNKLANEPKIDISRIKKEFNFKPNLELKKSLLILLENFKKKLFTL
jgi:nucleoside-diphosphate-sugar epimerase